MAIFTYSSESTDLVKDGATNIKTLKTTLNTLLGFLFSDSAGTRAANGITTTMITDANVTPAKVSPGSANQVLRTNSGGTAAEWGAVPAAAISGIVNSQVSAAAAIGVDKLAHGGANGQVLMSTGSLNLWTVPYLTSSAGGGGSPTYSVDPPIIYGTEHIFAHNMGRQPTFVQWFLVAQSSPELGYTAGMEVLLPAGVFNTGSNNPRIPAVYQDTTNCYLWLDSGLTLKLPDRSSGGSSTAIDTSKWRLRCRVQVWA